FVPRIVVPNLRERTAGHIVVKNGDFQAYDVPGSTFTQIWDVNPRHEFVGTYVDNAGTRHGFVQVPDGSAPSVLDFPGAAATIAFGVNPAGVVVGQYTASGQTHGFVAVPAGGRKSHVRPWAIWAW